MLLPEKKLTVENGRLKVNERSRAWTASFERTDGWRMADGGQGIPLPGDRMLWMWGDTFSTYQNEVPPGATVHFTFGSTVALSGLDPQALGGPPVKFFARDPSTGQAIDISSGDGVRTLEANNPGALNAGGWEITGRESDPEADPPTWSLLWFYGGIDVDGTLYLFYTLNKCKAPSNPGFDQNAHVAVGCNFINLDPTASTYPFVIDNTQSTIENWGYNRLPYSFGPILNKFSNRANVAWTWFYDDRKDSGFVYAFGIGPEPPIDAPSAPNNGNLYVARIVPGQSSDLPPDRFLDYQRFWQFLHDENGELQWVTGDDTPSKLKVLATNVAQEFSIHKLTIDTGNDPVQGLRPLGEAPGLTRWILAHAYWPFGIQSNDGIIRISDDGTFLTFPEDEEDFYWFDATEDLEPDLPHFQDVGAATNQWCLFRGFSAYPQLSQLPELLVGYTIFSGDIDGPIDCFSDPNCIPYGNTFCGDHGGPCGARRFAVIDLSKIWPKRELYVLQPSLSLPPTLVDWPVFSPQPWPEGAPFFGGLGPDPVVYGLGFGLDQPLSGLHFVTSNSGGARPVDIRSRLRIVAPEGPLDEARIQDLARLTGEQLWWLARDALFVRLRWSTPSELKALVARTIVEEGSPTHWTAQVQAAQPIDIASAEAPWQVQISSPSSISGGAQPAASPPTPTQSITGIYELPAISTLVLNG